MAFVARRAFCNLRTLSARHTLLQQRTICSTLTLQKQKGNAIIDDLFSDEAVVDDLFQRTSKEKSPESPESSPQTSGSMEQPSKKRRHTKLEPAERLAQFTKHYEYVEPRAGKGSSKDHRMRLSTWNQLVELAASEEQLKRVVDLFPAWAASGRTFKPGFAELFAQRCQDLQCPPLALEVFGNFAKYQLSLTQPAAQWLIHSLQQLYPLPQLLVAVSLLEVYKLPPISEDVVSSSMLVAACLKDGSPESMKLAEGLIPQIQELVRKSEVLKATEHLERKRAKWVLGALKRINRSLGKEVFPASQLELAAPAEATVAPSS